MLLLQESSALGTCSVPHGLDPAGEEPVVEAQFASVRKVTEPPHDSSYLAAAVTGLGFRNMLTICAIAGNSAAESCMITRVLSVQLIWAG